MNRTRKYRKGQIILYGGEATNAVFVVKSGIVRAYSISENGNEVIIALFGAGDYFPSFHSEHENPIALFYCRICVKRYDTTYLTARKTIHRRAAAY